MKLNLHCHTNYSDGGDSFRDMAIETMNQGHVAFVCTDHDYMMNPIKYEQQLHEAKLLEEELNFPIICGLECSFYSEEAVLIGKDACRTWLNYREEHQKTYPADLPYMFKIPAETIANLLYPFNHAFCLVHPGGKGLPELYKLFHCHEIMNSGAEWPLEAQEKIQNLAPQSKPVRGIDAHSINALQDIRSICNNVDSFYIEGWNESNIIKWMKTNDPTYIGRAHLRN